VEKSRTHVLVVLGIACLLALELISNRWKSATAVLPPAKGAGTAAAMHREPVSREQFLTEIFKEVKPPLYVSRIIAQNPADVPADSLRVLLKWSSETGLEPLTAMLEADIAEKNPTSDNLTSAARNMIFSGAEFRDYPIISAYLLQRGKVFIDKGLAMNNQNIPLRNALITYISEYENEPMKFLAVLRETLAMDSNNVETHFIHLGLLRKSGQWKKAIAKCEKLISLQPQNPMWLFQLSDVYGQMGDSTNAKTYLGLAVKAQKKQQTSN
jgi:tetratricopeptide (TPR) repeat protein